MSWEGKTTNMQTNRGIVLTSRIQLRRRSLACLHIRIVAGFKSCIFLDVDRKDYFSSQHRYGTDFNGSLLL